MLKRGNNSYIVFLAIVIPTLLFFCLSRFIFKAEKVSVSSNYNVTVNLNNYLIKISNAVYKPTTKEVTFTSYIKQKSNQNQTYPSIYSISADYNLEAFCQYNEFASGENEFATDVTITNIEENFKYIRIFYSSKKADNIVPESTDEFGNIIPSQIIEGETLYLCIIIDKEDMMIADENGQVKNTTSVSGTIFDEENVVTIKTDVAPNTAKTDKQPSVTTIHTVTTSVVTTTTAPKETTVTTAITTPKVTTTKAPVVTTATKKPVTVTTTTTKKPVTVTTTTKKPTTTTKKATTTTKVTTTQKVTTTKTTTTTLTPIRLRGLALKTVSENNTVYIKVGESTQVTPVYTPAQATNKLVYWSSNREDRAVVDSNGKVTGRSPGAVIIKCVSDDGGLTAACMIIVEE